MTKSLKSFSTLTLLAAFAFSPLWAANSAPVLNIPTSAIGEEIWSGYNNPVVVGPVTAFDSNNNSLTPTVGSPINGSVVLTEPDKNGNRFAVFTATAELNSRSNPPGGFTFDCSASDGTTTTTKTVNITIYMTPIGTTPDAVCDENSSVKIYLTGDTDGPDRNFTTPLPENVPALNGTVSQVEIDGGGSFVTFTPTPGKNSVNTPAGFGFIYNVSDTFLSIEANVHVTVNAAAISVPPTVKVTASDADAAETSIPGANSGVFTVSRTGDTTSPLTVYFTVGGNATPGSDYGAIGNSVAIPSGSSSAAVVVVPIDDAVSGEFTESVNLTISTDVNYSIDNTAASAQVLITDNEFFLSPVNPQPTVNTVKAGSSVPVKFYLGGNYGLNIFCAGYPASQQIPNDNQAPTDAIEETSTAGSSGLSYNATTGVYTYVWKTDKAWANTSRQLIIRLTNGTEQKATFKFSK